jgi:nucleotide-binding universal stress UspA family protein
MTLKKILLPVDFSDQSRGAARYAAALARHFQADLTLLHVSEVPAKAFAAPAGFGGTIDGAWITTLEANRRKDLQEFEKELFEGLQTDFVVMTGDAAEEILSLAAAIQADLIVMPTHGYGPFRQFLLGSVTAKVLHDAKCPVWTGAHLKENSAHEWEPMQQILCAVDNGPASVNVLKWASKFASEFGALTTIVHAVPKLDSPDDVLDQEGRRKRKHAAEKQIHCFQEKLAMEAEVIIEEGEPAKVAAKVAEQLGASLVVVGRSVEASASGRLGSHAYSLIRESPCPVVSI